MSRIRLIVLLFCLAFGLGAAARAGEGDTLITDPALLARLGFPPDARNVYLAKGAVLDQKASLATKEFGTDDFGWTNVSGDQHHPLDSASEYTIDGAVGDIRRSSGSGLYDAQLQMPSGALIRQVAWFGRDDDGSNDMSATVLRVCQTGIPAGPPVAAVLGSGDSSPASGGFVLTVIVPPGEAVNNLNCLYLARTHFHLGTTDLALRKIRAGWQRQVSPEPASATFPNDTPITHPYFRFIEALARSGITAGCAPGSFCPDSPITRGEMAVFLADALGLHFTN